MSDNANSWNSILNKLREELSGLAKFVDQTRQGIDNLETTVKISSEKFPEASTQLNAVTGDLENAANNIMNILEGLMADGDTTQALLKEFTAWALTLKAHESAAGAAIIRKLEDMNAKSKNDMMEIFTNMSFQDLTGQKLKKVIGSLAVVESKLLELALNFGFNGGPTEAEKKKVLLGELKGPTNAMPIDQNVVDRIMKELGA
ncbi:MAG: protein phosphatase CheZ [Deltaproteobacteria bacterium]|nr:protein phosphatase CheZ [Deltaproteobacteria bacterium]